MNPIFEKIIKEIQFNSPFRRYFFPRYVNNFTVPQLCFLCQCIEQTRDVEGSIAEIGCAYGSTTIFLGNYIINQGIDKNYYAIDTFTGFVSEDIDFEVDKRGKTRELFSGFQVNKKKWFDWTMKENKIKIVQSIEADVNAYDLGAIGPFSFALLDVDLYRPMKKALKELHDRLNPGGMIVVDDCDSSNIRWDGSDQAYKEFMQEIGQPTEIILGKLGVIRKGA